MPYWNFHWKLKFDSLPLLVQCVPALKAGRTQGTGVAKTVGPRFREFSRQCGRKWPKQKQEQELNSQKWGPTRRKLPYQIPTVIIKWISSKLFYGTTIWSVHTFILVSKFLWFQNSLCYDNNLSARRPSCFSKLSCEVCASPMHHKLHC